MDERHRYLLHHLPTVALVLPHVQLPVTPATGWKTQPLSGGAVRAVHRWTVHLQSAYGSQRPANPDNDSAMIHEARVKRFKDKPRPDEFHFIARVDPFRVATWAAIASGTGTGAGAFQSRFNSVQYYLVSLARSLEIAIVVRRSSRLPYLEERKAAQVAQVVTPALRQQEIMVGAC